LILLVATALPPVAAAGQPAPAVTAAAQAGGERDFDWQTGTWKTHLKRLLHPLTGSATWVEYTGVSVVRPALNGRASLLDLRLEGAAGRIEGIGLRLYNPRSRQWSLNWASGADGTMTTPMIGEFKNGRGEFYSQEMLDGRAIYVRNGFWDITVDSARFEQAFSDDGGKTWETNWIMRFERIRGERGGK